MNKKKLFEAVRAGLKTETVDIFGQSVEFHEITAADFIKASEIAEDDVAKSDAFLIIAGCDELEDSDLDDVVQWPIQLTRKISKIIVSLSGLGEDSVDEGKSEKAPT
jgi:hypothetical protein